METKYDQDVLKGYAQVLYVRALRLAWWRLVVGVFQGFILAFLVLSTIGAVTPFRDSLDAAGVRASHVQWLFLVLPVVMGLRGWRKGQAEGWTLRLEAQRVLCQVQIEENTRKA